MKLLFINLPYYGHVVPTIGLVQELIKKGCEVTYLMPFDWQDKIAESGERSGILRLRKPQKVIGTDKKCLSRCG